MKVRSQVYPTTNIVPIDGGHIKVTSDQELHDRSHDTEFVDVANQGVFDLSSQSGTVSSLGGGLFHLQTHGGLDSAAWQYPTAYNVQDDRQELSMYLGAYEPISVSSGTDIYANFTLDEGGLGERLEFRASYDMDLSQYELRVQFEEAGGNTTKTFYSDDPGFDCRIVIKGGGNFVAGFVKDGEFTKAFEAKFTATQMNAALAIQSSAEVKIRLGMFRAIPYLDLPSRNASTAPVFASSVGTTLYYDVFPAYPGTMEATLWGTGVNLGQTDTAEVEFTDLPIGEDPLRFAVSPVEELYDDAQSDLRCKEFGEEAEYFNGNVKMHNECVCDGSAMDDSKLFVEVTGGKGVGRASSPRRGDEKMEFIVEEALNDGYGSVRQYGENFDFSRISHDLGTSFTSDRTIKFLRTLEMDSGDRVYYGVLYTPLESRQIDFGFNSISSEDPAWELGRADTGAVIDSDPTGSSAPASRTLDKGVYYYTVSNADAEVFWSSADFHILSAMPDMLSRYDSDESASATPEGEGNYSEGLRDHKMFFEVKEYRAELVVFHHDRCNNTMTPYMGGALDVSLRSDSLAAVETLDGNVALIYEAMDDYNVWGNRSSELAYKVLDLDAGTFSARESLRFPSYIVEGSAGINAFDAVRIEDNVHFILTPEFDEKKAWSPDLSSEPLTFAAKLTTEGADMSGFEFKTGRDTIYSPVSSSFIQSTSGAEALTNLYHHGYSMDELFTESYINSSMDHPTHPASFPYLRAQYDESRDEVLVAMLNQRNRAPMIISGSGSEWREVALPRHFDFYSGGIRNVGHDAQKYTHLKSLSACYGADGMIYSLAVRGVYPTAPADFPPRTSELAVIDPAVEEPLVYIPNTGSDRWEGANFGDSRGTTAVNGDYARFSGHLYRFQTLPVWNAYQQADGGGLGIESAHLTLDDGYLVATLGTEDPRPGDAIKRYPLIYQSCMQDEAPFGVPLDEVWLPEYEDDTDYLVEHVDGPYPDTWHSARIENGYNDGVDIHQAKVSRKLDAVSERMHKAPTGYRFSARLQREGDETYFANNFIFEATAVKEWEPDLHTEARCRMVYNGKQVDCRVGDGDGGWTSVGTLCGLGASDIRDFHIVVQHHDNAQDRGRRFRAIFFVKTNEHANRSQGVHAYDFRTKAVIKRGTGVAQTIDTPGADHATEFACFFDNSTVDNTDAVLLHEMGWGLLRTPGLLSEVIGFDESFANGEQNNGEAVGVGGEIVLDGEKWRDFNDVKLFSHSGQEPVYSYRVSEGRQGSKVSDTYHWPNGFEFFFSGEVSSDSDRWMLDRKVLSNTHDIQTDRVHGYYTTLTDDTPVHIWADAQDSGLETFEADTFIITGANVPEVTIVGKNNIGDNWTDVDTLDLRKYETGNLLTPVNYPSVNRSIIKIDRADFEEGRFSEFVHYLGGTDPLSANKAGKIASSFSSTIWVDTNADYKFEGERAEIFADRGALVLDNPVGYRYLGIRIDPYHTHEGKFKLHSFDFGRSSSVPLKYGHDAGTGASQEAETEVNFVFDEQPYTSKKYSLRKEFELEYSLTDAKTLSKLQSVVKEVGVSRKAVWVLENNGAYKEKVYQCFIEDGATYTPLLDDDGERYYKFEMTLRSSE